MLKIFALSLSLLSINAFASTNYIGTEKKSKTACSLEIINTYYAGEELKQNLKIDVAISLDDGHGHGAEVYHLTVTPGVTTDLYTGFAANGKDQLNIFSSDANNLVPTMFAYRWLHGNHFHSAQCLNLTQE